MVTFSAARTWTRALCSVCWLLVTSPASATYFVVVKGDTGFAFAVDSRVTIETEAGPQYSSLCKIYPTRHGSIYSVAGYAGFVAADGEVKTVVSGLDALSREAENFEQLSLSFGRFATSVLDDVLVADGGLLRTSLHRAKLTVVALGLDENPQPSLTVDIIRPKVSVSGEYEGLGSKHHRFSLADDINFLFFDANPRVEARLEDLEGSFTDSQATELAKELVNLAIIDNPATNGHPVDVIWLDHSGFHWVQAKEACRSAVPLQKY